MKPILFSLLTATSVAGVNAQLANIEKAGAAPMVYTVELNGTRASEEWNRRDIKGSPFQNENFKKATVTLADKRSFNDVPVRFNFANNSIHYQTAKGEELVAPAGAVKEVIIRDTVGKFANSVELVSGYPAVGKHDSNTFYQRVVNGNAQFLVFTKKRMVDGSTLGSAGADKEWMGSDSYYVYRGGVMKQWEKGKDFLLEMFADKRDTVAEYISKQGLKCKSLDDFGQVLKYYNSLP